ncbi:protein FAM98C [Alligator mississippiensis]|uniref:protein FAM98C n=1 Tax=Alligator mississippiensis TaxID=8496 RepID=UPI0028779FB7|nr:protein FAM98C [Alligator mississippiensis]
MGAGPASGRSAQAQQEGWGEGMEREPAGCLELPWPEELAVAAAGGAGSAAFTGLCVRLAAELRALCALEEDISPPRGPEDAETFAIEMSGLLAELRCPYPALTTGPPAARLARPQACLQLLGFLNSELQAARILQRRRCDAPELGAAAEVRQELQLLCQVLDLPPPSPGCPDARVLADVHAKVSQDLSALPGGNQEMAPLLRAPLTSPQWEVLERIHEALRTEYECRRRVMVTRFAVTLQSFQWAERAKEHGAALPDVLTSLRRAGAEPSAVTLARLLAVRADASRLVPASAGAARLRTCCSVNKVLMGSVPDRGGRPSELEAPMPSWEPRRQGGGGGARWGRKGKKKK